MPASRISRSAGTAALPYARAKQLRCAYHGWTYALDGQLKGTPEFAGVENFKRESVRLEPLKAEVWGPMVFVNLDREALSRWLAERAPR